MVIVYSLLNSRPNCLPTILLLPCFAFHFSLFTSFRIGSLRSPIRIWGPAQSPQSPGCATLNNFQPLIGYWLFLVEFKIGLSPDNTSTSLLRFHFSLFTFHFLPDWLTALADPEWGAGHQFQGSALRLGFLFLKDSSSKLGFLISSVLVGRIGSTTTVVLADPEMGSRKPFQSLRCA